MVCSRGHEGPEGANFCPTCGETIDSHPPIDEPESKSDVPATPDAEAETQPLAPQKAPGTAALILSLVGLVVCIAAPIGLGMGIAARVSARRQGLSSKKANYAIGLGVLAIVLVTTVGVLASLDPSEPVPEPVTDASEVEEMPEEVVGPRPKAWSDVSQNLLDKVYDADPTSPTWNRITDIQRRLLSSDQFVRMRIETDFEMASAADVMAATELCNALVKSVPREGFQVDVTGRIVEGVTNADGSIETAVNEREFIARGQSGDREPEFCHAKVRFTALIPQMQAAGWREDYSHINEEMIMDTRYAQDGDVYFLDR